MNNREVIATLNTLLQTTKDGAKGFRTCSKDVKNGSLTPVFDSSADRCDQGAAVLETEIRKLGGEPAKSGSVSGTLHRRWTDIMSSVTGMEEHVVLEECERGEDAAMRHYEAALKEALPTDIEAIVRRQYAGVKANHDRIHALRDQSATRAS
jgi:uncharacterized protein (TIGR02284 family)